MGESLNKYQHNNNNNKTKTAGIMAQSGAPVTIRNFLNDDPFFKNTWEDFDKLTEGMFSEPRSTWKRFDQDFRNRACMQESSQETASREERREFIKENSSLMRNVLNSKLSKGLDSLKTNVDDSKMEF